ncbi:MAG: hypothetical protein M3P30_14880 [Chloroflexota bacterium]|nr:hypothetical protein [Chloroflexota bacterium]
MQRLIRAYEQIKMLHSEIIDMSDARRMPVAEQFDHEGGEIYRWTLVASVLAPPEFRLSVIVGEIIHDLRSALDNLACALAYQNSQSRCESTEFPIFSDSKKFRRKRSRLIGEIDPDAQAIIEGLQPYHRGQDFRCDPLWMLYQLSNIDKHRLFHLTTWVIDGANFDVDPGSDVDIIEKRTLVERGVAEYGTPLAYARIRVKRVNAIMEVKYDFPLDIAFDQGNTAAPRARVAEILCMLADYIIGIAESFERFAPSPIYVHRTSGFEPNPDYRG